MATILPTDPPPVAVRAKLERQLQAVVGFLDDHELDALLDLAVALFLDPQPLPMVPDGIAVHQVEARLRRPVHGAGLGALPHDLGHGHSSVHWHWRGQ